MIYYQNVRGLRTKLSDLRQSIALLSHDPDIIIFTETWLNDSIADAELGLSNYCIYRKDRNAAVSDALRGGGVLIAVRDCLFSRPLNISIDNIEHCFVVFQLRHKHVIVGSVYLPPDSDLSIYESHCLAIDEALSRMPESSIIIVGDYNLPNIHWSAVGNTLVYYQTGPSRMIAQANVIAQYFNEFNFRQYNNVVNSNGNCLDLVFSNLNDVCVHISLDPLIDIDKFHPPLLLSLPIAACPPPKSCTLWRSNFRKANYVAINDYLSGIAWDEKLEGLSVDDALELVYSHLYTAVDFFVPVYAVSKSLYPTWFSRELIAVAKSKRRAHRRYKESNLYCDYLSFSHLRARCKSLSANCFNNYVHRSEIAVNNNVNVFWNFVKSLNRNKTHPSYIYHDGAFLSNSQGIANCFADYFESVYKDENCLSVDGDVSREHDLCLQELDISIGDVFNSLNSLAANTGPGTDAIPSTFFKSCNFIMSRILWLIFNKSLNSGVFPDVWKLSIVTPIFKSGDRSLVSNYRPICKQSIMPKLFENIIAKKLSSLLKNVIIEEQHGFMAGRSVSTNLLLYHDYLCSAVEDGAQVDSIYTDFKKAFDSVNHNILIRKLRALGVDGKLLLWISSFIIGRHQRVKFGDALSNNYRVPSGVPQGSHLGPLLFNIFINDIGKVLKSAKFLLFADDLKLFLRINSQHDAQCLQDDLNNLDTWGRENLLEFNLNKCHTIHFSKKKRCLDHEYLLGGAQLPVVMRTRDLGVVFCHDLTFEEHIMVASCCASKRLGFILRARKFFKNVSTLKLLYNAFVRSRLEYASVVWAPYQANHIVQIERIQHRFLRGISNHIGMPMTFKDHNYYPLLFSLNMLTLKTRRVVTDLLFLFKLLNGLISCPELLGHIRLHVPVRLLRSHLLFHVDIHRTNYGKFKPLNRLSQCGNEYASQIDFFGPCVKSFRCSVVSLMKTIDK